MADFSPDARLAACGLLVLASVTSAAEAPTGWTDVETAHFTVKTDLSSEAARHAAVLAENSRAALLAAAWPRFKLVNDRLALVVFSDRRDFQHYFGDVVQAQAVFGSGGPAIYLFGEPDRWEKSVVRSEAYTSVLMQALARYLTALFYQSQPTWFSTGLAEFLSTVHVSQDGKTASIGHRNYGAYDNYRTYRSATVADALAWGSTLQPTDEATLLSLGGLSWLMVAWMYNTHRAEFVRFQALLGTSLDPKKAWETVFPTLNLGDLDQELYRFSEPFLLATVVIPEADYSIEQARPMTWDEVQATRTAAALAGEQAPAAVGGPGSKTETPRN